MAEYFIDLTTDDVAPIGTETEIEVDEAVGWAEGTPNTHDNLPDRNEPNQHTTAAITGLDAQLAKIEMPRVLESNKHGIANYYQWDVLPEDGTGYFVSLVPESANIKICDGTNIFGVTVDEAGFIGNQDQITDRGNNYGLVATSGLVDVRCMSDINVGDYVVANNSGLAVKTDSDCGYKVISTVTKDGTAYVSIVLGVQACTTNLLGLRVNTLEQGLENAEFNILAAMAVANEAALKAGISDITSSETQEKIDSVLDNTNNMLDSIDQSMQEIEAIKQATEQVVQEAEAIANSAVDKANSALAKAEAVEQETQYVLSQTEETAESYERLIGSVDKYCIGEFSQSYGLSVEQARSILKPGMIYIPIVDIDTHKEAYVVTVEGNEYSFETKFTEGVYYKWESISLYVDTEGGKKDISGYWWKAYPNTVWPSEIIPKGMTYEFWFNNATLYKLELNCWEEFEKPIWTGAEEPTSEYAYWFIENVVKTRSINEDGDAIWASYNTVVTDTQPQSSDCEFWYDGAKFYTQWIQVNTLAGNVNSRISSLIRQDVDAITAEIVNAHGSVAGFGAWLTDTESATQQLSTWKTAEEEKMAVVRTEATEDGSQVIIGALSKDENGEIIESATLKLEVAQDADGNPTSNLKIAADSLQFTAEDYQIIADNIALEGLVTITDLQEAGATTINGSNITTGSIESANYKESEGAEGMKLDLTTGVWDSPKFKVKSDGLIKATNANIEGTINAQNGQIGLLTIEDGVVKMGDNPNLVRDYDKEVTSNYEPAKTIVAYWILPIASEGVWTDTYDGQQIGSLVKGRTYTVRIDITPNEDVEFIELSTDNGDVQICQIPIETDKSTLRHIITQTFTFNGYADGDTPPEVKKAQISLKKKLYESSLNNGSKYKPMTIHSITIKESEADLMMRLSDEGLYVKGEIEASGGKIADILIEQQGLAAYQNDQCSWTLQNDGLSFRDNLAKLQIGPLSIYSEYNEENSESDGIAYVNLNSLTRIQAGSEGAALLFNADSSSEVTRIYVYLYCYQKASGTYICAKTENDVFYDFDIDVQYIGAYQVQTGWDQYETKTESGTVHLSIKSTTRCSDYVVLGSGIQFSRLRVYAGRLGEEWYHTPSEEEQVIDGRYFKQYTQRKSPKKIICDGHFIPDEATQGGGYDLGSSGNPWYNIYSHDGSVVASDKNKKNTIRLLDEAYNSVFDALQPVSYRFNNNTSNRTHTGFIAQDVKEAIESVGLTTQDFAGYCEWEENDGEIGCGLRYGEFVSLNTWQIQKLKARVSELEERILKLEAKLSEKIE